MARRRNAVARERRRAKAEAARRALLPPSCSGCGGDQLVKKGCDYGRQRYSCRACGCNSYGDGPPVPRPHYPCPYCGAQCWKAGKRKRADGKVQEFRCSACRRMNTRLWPEDVPSPGGPFPHVFNFGLNYAAHQAILVYCQAKQMRVAPAVRDIFIQAAKAPAIVIGIGRPRSYGSSPPPSSTPTRSLVSAGPPLPVIPPGGVRLPSAFPAALEKLAIHRHGSRYNPAILVTARVCVALNDLALASLMEMMRRRGMNHQDTARALIAETAPRLERVWASRADDGGLDGW